VLAAMETPAEVASSFLRISFGSSTSNSDIDRFLGEWRRMVKCEDGPSGLTPFFATRKLNHLWA